MSPIITSGLLNYLIFQYLNESGLLHSAFVIKVEAGVNKNETIDPNIFPPQALITLVQKGLQHMEMEANSKSDDEDDEDADDSFVPSVPMELINEILSELREIMKERKKKKNLRKGKEKVAGEEQEEEKETVRQERKKNLQKGKEKVTVEEHEEEKEPKKHKPAIKSGKPTLWFREDMRREPESTSEESDSS